MSTPTTMKEMARRLNVTVSTVSRALQNHPRIGLRTREKVQALARQLDYVPNSTAVHLKQKRTYTLGVIVPFLTEQFFSFAISGIEDIAITKGYSVLITQSRNDYERERLAITNFIRHGVDGIIVSLGSETHDKSHFLAENTHGIPVIFFDRVAKDMPNSYVCVDMKEGAIDAIDYLVGLGLDKIALLNGPCTLQATEERQQGYEAALTNHGIRIRPEYLKNSDLTQADTLRKTSELLDLTEPPQAILAFNDYLALDAMQVCRQRNLIINQDIYFISFSNFSFCSYLEQPPIAAIEQFPYKMGVEAVQLVLSAIEDPAQYSPQQIVLQPELIIRAQ